MNSKKALVPLGITIVATLLLTILKAQPTVTYRNNYIIVTTPSIKPQDYENNTKHSYTSVFLETGDGGFLRPFTTSGYQQQTFNKRWLFRNTNLSSIIVHTNTYYDTIHRPPTDAMYELTPSPSDVGHVQYPDILSVSNPSIAITPSVVTVIPGDPMTLAITYKNATIGGDVFCYNSSVIAFYYNATATRNTDFFNPLNASSVFTIGNRQVSSIRTFNGENMRNFADLPIQVRNKLTTYNSNYSQALYFVVPFINSSTEKNIFLSLSPNPDSSNYKNLTDSVRAVMIDYNTGNIDCIDNPMSFLQVFPIRFDSRDPNFIHTIPESFKDTIPATNKKIDYHIHFSNIGAGNAQLVTIDATLPSGVPVPPYNSNPFTCTIGNTKIAVVRDGSNFATVVGASTCIYHIFRDQNKIRFTITNANLKGTVETNGINNAGDITFSLRTSLNKNDIKPCMISKMSVKFNNNNDAAKDAYFRTRVGIGIFQNCPPELNNTHVGD